MNRRDFIKALGAGAAVLGLPSISTPNQIRTRGDDLIRVSATWTGAGIATLQHHYEEEIEHKVRRMHAEAVRTAERHGWRSWRSRLVDTSICDMDAMRYEVVLERRS